jgi:2-polyprenyl-3-methyl-5-hydroxy-6-metoxy-1,4-benzoquinol methylase
METMLTESEDYNARLFDGGLRGRLHGARFHFLAEVTKDVPNETVFELGCFDGRSIAHLARRPSEYVGADAGWEGGLEQARKLWPQFKFYEAHSAEDLLFLRGRSFDISICMETFEHVPVDHMSGYIDLLADITTSRLIVTVPVELGPVFLAKHLLKRILPYLNAGDAEFHSYTFREIVYATLGMTSRVKRGEHKGFDYRWLREMLERRFHVVTYEGHPFTRLPRWLNFGVGMVCVPK